VQKAIANYEEIVKITRGKDSKAINLLMECVEKLKGTENYKKSEFYNRYIGGKEHNGRLNSSPVRRDKISPEISFRRHHHHHTDDHHQPYRCNNNDRSPRSSRHYRSPSNYSNSPRREERIHNNRRHDDYGRQKSFEDTDKRMKVVRNDNRSDRFHRRLEDDNRFRSYELDKKGTRSNNLGDEHHNNGNLHKRSQTKYEDFIAEIVQIKKNKLDERRNSLSSEDGEIK
jgi:hypothetical protein